MGGGMIKNTSQSFNREYFHHGRKSKKCYHDYNFESYYPKFQFLAKWIKDHYNATRVLDVGCAKGFLVKAFREIGIEAYGVDISSYAISNSFEDTPPYLYELDLSRDALPFPDGYFDFVTFLQTIEYLSNHKYCLSEIKRVTRDGGGIHFTTSSLKEISEDERRVNIHDKDYWIEEFHSYGFRFAAKKVEDFLKAESDYKATLIENILILAERHVTSQRRTIKFRLGRLLYHNGGCIGRALVRRVGPLMVVENPNYGYFFFIKEVG